MDVFEKLFPDDYDFYNEISQNKKCKEIEECMSIKENLFVKKLPEDLHADFYSYQGEISGLLEVSQYEAFKLGFKACSDLLFNNR